MDFRDWSVPLSRGAMTLREAAASLAPYGMAQDKVPLVIQLVENPKYKLPGVEIFSGATDLRTHDLIHIVLGRGLLTKDEAFVIGFTMGSTRRCHALQRWLYTGVAKHLYPREYRFNAEAAAVFRDAVYLGEISGCTSLADVDFQSLLDVPLAEIRRRLNVHEDLLRAYFSIESARYPSSRESQRLLD